MLKQIIEATRLSPEFCASLLRVPAEQFREWMDGKRPVPQFVIPELSTILGVNEKSLLARGPVRGTDGGSLAPAIWFKLRADNLTAADREFVGLVRRLGFFMAQVEVIRGIRSSPAWRAVAQAILGQVDRSAPPAVQGRDAALSFRSAANLEHGQTGIGELIRPRLRQIGMVVIESPIPKSSLEGCCFNIGREGNLRPCVFANTFKSTWFRRNEILLHEVCHAIFDLENDPVSLDFRDQSQEVSALSEVRARVFAQETLVPRAVLVHYTSQLGLNWQCLTAQQIAQLVAAVHVEQETLLRAAHDNGFISEERHLQYSECNCGTVLREISFHAWTTREFVRQQAGESPKWIAENRNTTVGARSLRLPAGYVQQVIETLNMGEISMAKAAELLMMDRYSFAERFGDLVAEPIPA
jgi:Zn-dependent peptidase ImmA (M78 family)